MWAIIDYLNLEGVKELWSKITSHVKSVMDTKADMIHASQHASDGPDPITPDSIGLGDGLKYVEKVSEYVPFTGDGGIINNVFSAGGKIIVLGFGDTVKSFKYSEDGFHWEDLELPVTCGYYASLAYANGRFLLNLDQRTDEFLYSDDGKTWHVISAGPNFDGYYPLYSTGDKFFYVDHVDHVDYDSIYISSDGIEWTKIMVTTSRIGSIYGIAILGNKIVAPIGEAGVLICEDINDLSAWTRYAPVEIVGDDVMCTNNILVSTYYNFDTGNTKVLYSKDGIEWTDSSLIISGSVTDQACGNGKFILRNMKDIYYSTDGRHWGKTTCPYTINALQQTIYHDGKFIMFGTTSSSMEKFLISSNGVDWSRTAYAGLETASGENVTLNIERMLRNDSNVLTNAEIDAIVSSVFGT